LCPVFYYAELEKDSTPFDEVFVKLQDEKAIDSKFVNRLQRMLIKMQVKFNVYTCVQVVFVCSSFIANCSHDDSTSS